MAKKEIVAMLLAGGQGSRLKSLTTNIAKPAVPFGGRYRIIDFTLSNCTNSGIDTVGVLTQYRPFELNSHIGTGAAWDLDFTSGGVYTLPPYVDATSSTWYEGTAHAIYRNKDFIEKYDPEYVLILSGDHIYKMNYMKMLEWHKAKAADCTIAVLEVPWEEASRYGLMNTNKDMEIVEFEEKPENPKSNLASMGIYIFTWSKLKELFETAVAQGESIEDFGYNVLPHFIQGEHKVFAYPFKGYWKDVGTIDSYWEANLEIIDPQHPLKLYDRSWIVYSGTSQQPPQYIAESAVIRNSLITDGCRVFGHVENSVLFPGAIIEEGAVVIDSVIMDGAIVSKDTYIEKAIIGEKTVVPPKTKLGDRLGETVELLVKGDEVHV